MLFAVGQSRSTQLKPDEAAVLWQGSDDRKTEAISILATMKSEIQFNGNLVYDQNVEQRPFPMVTSMGSSL